MALELGLKLTANTSGFTGAINSASKALSDTLSKSIVDAKGSLTQLDPAIQKAVQGIDMMNFSEVSAEMDKFVMDGTSLSSFLERVKGELGGVDDQEGFTDLSKVIQQSENQLKRLSATEETTASSGRSLKSQLRQMNEELARMRIAGLEGTDAYKTLDKQAGQLKDTLRDASSSINTLSSDTFALDAGVGIVQNITAAFQVYEGVLSMTGGSTEDAQKSMQKLMAIMSIAQGIQQLGNFITEQSAAKKVLDTTATYVQATAYRVLTVSLGASSTAARIFATAIATTGVGALIIGLSIAASKLMDFASSANKAKEAQDALQASLDWEYAQTERRIKLFENKTKLDIANAKARGASEKELQDIEERGIRQKLGALTTLVRDQKASGTYIKKAEEDLVNAKLELDIFLADQKAGILEAQTKKNKEELDKQAADDKKNVQLIINNAEELKNELGNLKKSNAESKIDEIQNELDTRKSAGIKLGTEEASAYKVLQQELFAIKRQEIDNEYLAAKDNLIKIGALTSASGRQSIAELDKQYRNKIFKLNVSLDPVADISTDNVFNKGIELGAGKVKLPENSFVKFLKDQKQAAEESFKSINDQATNLANTLTSVLGNAFTSLFDGILSGSQNAFQSFSKAIADIIKRLAAAAITAAIFAAIISIAFPGAGSFGSQFGAIFGQMSGIKIPKFAEGGIVTSPRMGIVGEAGKEAIIPLDRIGDVLGSIGGRQDVFVTGELSGETIYLQQQRVSQRRGRFV